MALIFSGCAHSQNKNLSMLDGQRPIQSLSEDDLKTELWKRAGIIFKKSVFYFPKVTTGNMLVGKLFIQKKPLGTGDRMDKQLQQTSLKDGDLFLGVNGVSFSTPSLNVNGKIGDAAVFLDADSLEMKIIIVDSQYLELRDRIILSSSLAKIGLVTVVDVAPKSWAEKFQIERGDVLIGNARLREVQNQRKWFLGLVRGKKKFLADDREFPLLGLNQVNHLFLEVFRDLGKFHDRDGDVMELVSYLRIPLVRNGNIHLRELFRHRFLGLGIELNCNGDCAKMAPAVIKIIPGSEAEKVGLRVNDLISDVNGRPVKNSAEVLSLTAKIGPGADMEFGVIRGLENLRFRVTIGWVDNSLVDNK